MLILLVFISKFHFTPLITSYLFPLHFQTREAFKIYLFRSFFIKKCLLVWFNHRNQNNWSKYICFSHSLSSSVCWFGSIMEIKIIGQIWNIFPLHFQTRQAFKIFVSVPLNQEVCWWFGLIIKIKIICQIWNLFNFKNENQRFRQIIIICYI